VQTLSAVVQLSPQKLLAPVSPGTASHMASAAAVLVLLAAGKGTRFGVQPKCIQPVLGVPLARHSIDAFHAISPAPPICIVGYKYDEVASALGQQNIYVRSDNPAGGTAFAVYEAFSVPGLLEANPLLIITMGDRIVPPSIFRWLLGTHSAGPREAALTFLTARYEPPKHLGKGRVLRNEAGRVTRIVEEKDIASEPEAVTRQALLNLTEGNCPLYVVRAATLMRHLRDLSNGNAQGQFYLTDIVASIGAEGGEIRTVTTHPSEPEYDLLCSDVTRPADLALLEGVLARQRPVTGTADPVELAAKAVREGRPAGQVASIARQLQELFDGATEEKNGFVPDEPVAIGICGGRLRIAFMHPDMGRFFGPAWQMPIGAGDVKGGEQIVVLAQKANDGRIHLLPLDRKYRESVNFVPADSDAMYPGTEIADWHSYEGFGTRMSETLLLSLGYFSDEEIETRRRKKLPLPPATLRVASNMRRPFALVGNAIASMRTLREGHVGAKVQINLGRDRFKGLWLACNGDIPQGGFSSSSALTVATKNALNSLFGFGIPADLLVHLACQAEYGTGVRAGSLDQATEQKGRAGQGTLISSNPADNYRIMGTYTVPSDRFRVIFPYSVERDRAAWQWSGGVYAETSAPGGPLTAGEIRKMTGKAAEIAAILVHLPLETSFFKEIEADLMTRGVLGPEKRKWVCGILRQLPLLVSRAELVNRVAAQKSWYAAELQRIGSGDQATAEQQAESTFNSLFAGWREPILRRGVDGGQVVTETGVPLRAIMAYLFGEVAKNFHLIHHPDEWIKCVTRSQQGDRSIAIDPQRLPERTVMMAQLDWEKDCAGPERLARWLERHGAVPYDFNQALSDQAIADEAAPAFHDWPGGNFFRGLALIDLAEAMLKRAFGEDAVAVRVNAAGQGDYFQVHLDSRKVDPAEVKAFLRAAFYRRFGIVSDPEFVETHPGGGAIGLQLPRFIDLPRLIRRLEG
jgi:molybdopterin-guanine dinucleotide biosynthesis protein A